MNTLPLTKLEVVAYEIVSHGIEHSDYFQGCGTAFTSYDEVFTGIGDTEYLAMHEALELASHDYYWSDALLEQAEKEIETIGNKELYANEHGNNDIYWHVSIRIKRKEENNYD